MRSIWSGAISFGLINIPVQIFTAIQDRGLDLDMLHKKDLSPIRYARICKSEEKEVPYKDIVKGYQYQKGEYVILTDGELKRAHSQKTKTIEIQFFTYESEIEALYFEKPYYIVPDSGSSKAYALLREALKRSEKVAVATFVLHSKEHLAVIKPYKNGIILNQIRYHNELRNFGDLDLPNTKAMEKEVDMAVKLIDQLTDTFKPEQFKDRFDEEIKALVEDKLKGKKIRRKAEETEPQATHVQDIMSKLKASLTKYKTPVKRTSAKRKKVAAK